ncbi:MAG: hypothetical protein DI537_35635 [Stutzerimonas stutzeri]|nr:MAG: hypothetical protein DI537_35635 [Stutzerimonas stutzeri]
MIRRLIERIRHVALGSLSPVLGGGYLSIENTGPTQARLVGGSTEAVACIRIHESIRADGIVRICGKANGFIVPRARRWS